MMFPFFHLFQKLRENLRKGIYKAATSAIAVIIYGTVSEYYLENGIPTSGIHSFMDSLWWTMQTVTTVGYGDTPVYGFFGRLNAMAIMVVGIGSLGFFTASLAANLMDFSLARRLGEVNIKMKDHVIICNTDERIGEIIKEVTKNGMDAVILADDDPKLNGLDYSFVKGDPTDEESLRKAGLANSSKIVVLPGKQEGDKSSVDAKSILASMIIKKLRTDSYVIIELLSTGNYDHAKMAGANEIVIKGSMSSLMLSNAIFSPGVSKFFYELLRGDDGYRIREYRIDEKYKNRKCQDFYNENEMGGKVVLAFLKGDKIRIRPHEGEVITWDSVILMEPKDK